MKYFVHIGIGPLGCDMNDILDFGNMTEGKIQEEVHRIAWEHYECYAGIHGVMSSGDIAGEFEEQEGRSPDEEELQDWYETEVENCLDFYFEPYIPEKHDAKV